MTTPYALWRFVPLSECREIMAKLRLPRTEIERLYLQRALAAVTAERDQILDHLDGTIEQDKALINEYNDLRRQLAAVTAERDQFRDHLDGTIEAHKADIRRYNEMVAELKAVTAERDALRRELDAMTGEL